MQSSSNPDRLPTELLRKIVAYYTQDIPNSPSLSLTAPIPKPEWKDVEPLTLVSRAFRALSLEEWFTTYIISSPDTDIVREQFSVWPQLTMWTKTLRIEYWPRFDKDAACIDLKHFASARKTVIVIQPLALAAIFPFVHTPVTMHVLEIDGFRLVDGLELSGITRAFPLVRTLALIPRSIACVYCRMPHTPLFRGLPPALVYEGGRGLSPHLVEYLVSMRHLHNLAVTIAVRTRATSMPFDEQNELMWCGECHNCMAGPLSVHDAMRDVWINTKNKVLLRGACALQRVEWHFVDLGEEHNDENGDDGSIGSYSTIDGDLEA